MEKECVDEFKTIHEKVFLYNFNKLKLFFLKNMLRDSIFGKLSYEDAIKLHPKILRGVLSQIRIFDESNEEEEKRIAK